MASRVTISLSILSPGSSARAFFAVCEIAGSISMPDSSRVDRQVVLPTRPSASSAEVRTCFGPLFAAFRIAGKTTVFGRSAMAVTINAARSGASVVVRANSVAKASSMSLPGNSRAVLRAMLNRPLFGDLNCSSSRGIPFFFRARIAPRVASSIRCSGTSALRTKS